MQQQQDEEAKLGIKERQLAAQLFQRSSLNLFIRHLANDNGDTLRNKLKDRNPLIRLLVVSTIGGRHIHVEDDLIERLSDPDPAVREAGHKALVRVARGTDFGPIPGASQTGIARSIEKWRYWLALQQGQSPDRIAKTESFTTAKPIRLDSHKAITSILEHEIQTAPAISSEATRLCDELVKARGEERMQVLERLRDAKGIDNTDAITLAMPKLPIDVQYEARKALAQRMTRMTAATLRDKLQEDNVEVRRAAALACGRKNDRAFIPDLLQLLDDPELPVIQAARKALKELTGEDFGPDEEAGRRGRARAVAAWRKWWKERQAEQK